VRLPALAALGIAAYAAFLVATLPARVAAPQIESLSKGGIAIDDADGTVWHGSARAVVATPGGRLALDRVEWRFKPSRLVAGKLAYDVAATAPGVHARLEAARSPSRWEFGAIDARASAEALVAAVPWISAWRPEGAVAITSPALATDGNDLHGEARVEWRGAAVGLSEVKPLGTYRADLRAGGPGAAIALSTVDGPLRLSGKGTLTLPARLEFSGEARAEGPNAAALEPLLNLLGPRRPDGARALRWISR
jgi:general secretion pathway protein N